MVLGVLQYDLAKQRTNFLFAHGTFVHAHKRLEGKQTQIAKSTRSLSNILILFIEQELHLYTGMLLLYIIIILHVDVCFYQVACVLSANL